MVERINFIQKEPFSLTYRKFIVLAGSLFVFLALLYGIQVVRIHFVERRVKNLGAELNRLKALQEKRMSVLSLQNFKNASAQSKIREEIDQGVTWSKILLNLSEAMPNDLWLTDIKSYEKEGKGSKKSVAINGQAASPEAVALFVDRLSKNESFSDVFLSSSALEKESGRDHYVFSIDVAILQTRSVQTGSVQERRQP